MLTVVISVLLLHWRFGIWSLLIGNAASPLLLILWSLIVIRRITRSVSLLRLTWDRRRLRRVLSFGSPIFGATIIHTLLISMNKVFVARFAGTAAVPLYEISFVTSFKIRSLFESGLRSLAPEFSRLHALAPANLDQSVTAIQRKSSMVIRYGGTLVFLTAFLFARFGLKLWLGHRFAPELPMVFRVMLAGVFVSLWNVETWYTLLGFGRNTQLFFGTSIMALTNLGFILAWPRLVHQAPTLMTVVIGTSLGFLTCTVYLLREAAKLRRELAAKAPHIEQADLSCRCALMRL
jgi:O-antigen/teichoic acid export membrane protein